LCGPDLNRCSIRQRSLMLLREIVFSFVPAEQRPRILRLFVETDSKSRAYVAATTAVGTSIGRRNSPSSFASSNIRQRRWWRVRRRETQRFNRSYSVGGGGGQTASSAAQLADKERITCRIADTLENCRTRENGFGPLQIKACLYSHSLPKKRAAHFCFSGSNSSRSPELSQQQRQDFDDNNSAISSNKEDCSDCERDSYDSDVRLTDALTAAAVASKSRMPLSDLRDKGFWALNSRHERLLEEKRKQQARRSRRSGGGDDGGEERRRRHNRQRHRHRHLAARPAAEARDAADFPLSSQLPPKGLITKRTHSAKNPPPSGFYFVPMSTPYPGSYALHHSVAAASPMSAIPGGGYFPWSQFWSQNLLQQQQQQQQQSSSFRLGRPARQPQASQSSSSEDRIRRVTLLKDASASSFGFSVRLAHRAGAAAAAAEVAGIQPGDQLLELEGEPVANMTLHQLALAVKSRHRIRLSLLPAPAAELAPHAELCQGPERLKDIT
uniref:PDZ domain-containing protein n=1 Tax=Macrostomum lignano TaxID=282301 RepID=A0A1I8F8B3_9PLAT